MKNLHNILIKRRDYLYDCILMLSGGKDSVLALHDILSSIDLNILTISYDDGYLSTVAKENIDTISNYFRVDNLVIQHDIRDHVNMFVDSDLVKTVDLNTFIEVFQNIFWEKINRIAVLFGNIPIITGNICYFSSEEYLPDQHKAAKIFIEKSGLCIPQIDTNFISYWVEESYFRTFEILKDMGWKSNLNLDTDTTSIKKLRERLNLRYPKETLDDFAEKHWDELTRPRFRK